MLEEKLKAFANLWEDDNFRNIDMTDPHLHHIEIKDNCITPIIEQYNWDLEEYFYCNSDSFVNHDLVNQFKNLNLNDEDEVMDFIYSIEDFVDWDKARDNLQKQIDTKLENNNMEI